MITSSSNPKIQLVRALTRQRKERDAQGLYVAEGVRLIEEALAGNWPIEFILHTNDLSDRGKKLTEESSQKNIAVEEISIALLKSISATETSQGILAVVRQKEQLMPENLDFVLIIDVLRDPGNLGTILRSAAAAGTQAVLLTPGTTDPFSPKVLRSAMGAHFRLPILTMDWKEIGAVCTRKNNPLSILVSDAQQGESCFQMDLTRPIALVIGGEAEGITNEARQFASGWIKIPMPGKSESLNAAAAASILLFETVRQRNP